MAKRHTRIATPLSPVPAGGSVRLDCLMEYRDGRIVDRSGFGNDGTPSAASNPTEHDGAFDKALKFDATRQYIDFGGAASLDPTGVDFTCMAWCRAAVSADTYIMSRSSGGQTQYMFNPQGVGLTLATYTLGTGWVGSAIPAFVQGKWRLYAWTIQGGVYRHFLDGLQVGMGAQNPPNAVAGATMRLAVPTVAGAGLAGGLDGCIDHPVFCLGALSPAQIYAEWLAGASKISLEDTLEEYPVSVAAVTAGNLLGPYRVIGGSATVVVDATGRKWVQGGANPTWLDIVESQPLAHGTWQFRVRCAADALNTNVFLVAQNNAAAIVAGANGDWFVQIADDFSLRLGRWGVGNIIQTAAAYLAAATEYDLRVTRRIGGQWTMYVRGGAFTDWTLANPTGGGGANPTTNNNVTTSLYAPVMLNTSDRISDLLQLQGCVRPETYPWEFTTGTWAGVVDGDGQVMHACLTAGVTFVLHDFDWQTCEFDYYKGGGGNQSDIYLAVNDIGGEGYGLIVAANESIAFGRYDAGAWTQLAVTAAAYVAVTTKYQLRVIYDRNNFTFFVYIKGGAYANWTLALGPIIDATYTAGYVFAVDLDAADRVSGKGPAFDAVMR